MTSRVRVYKLIEEAVWPTKGTKDSAGFDLTAISAKRLGDNLWMLKTGIAVNPPIGTWGLLVARSSLFKHNLMLANGVGIIDNDYRGDLAFIVRKLDAHGPFPKLPLRCGQYVPMYTSHLKLVKEKGLPRTTKRGDGGFGSTG